MESSNTFFRTSKKMVIEVNRFDKISLVSIVFYDIQMKSQHGSLFSTEIY